MFSYWIAWYGSRMRPFPFFVFSRFLLSLFRREIGKLRKRKRKMNISISIFPDFSISRFPVGRVRGDVSVFFLILCSTRVIIIIQSATGQVYCGMLKAPNKKSVGMAFRQFKSKAGKRHNIDLSCTKHSKGMEVEDYVRILVIYIFSCKTPLTTNVFKCDPESLIHMH